jgi:hypothetical protein
MLPVARYMLKNGSRTVHDVAPTVAPEPGMEALSYEYQ